MYLFTFWLSFKDVKDHLSVLWSPQTKLRRTGPLLLGILALIHIVLQLKCLCPLINESPLIRISFIDRYVQSLSRAVTLCPSSISGVRRHRVGGGVLRPSARHPHRSGPRWPVPVRQPAAARQPDRRLLWEENPRRLQTAAGQFLHTVKIKAPILHSKSWGALTVAPEGRDILIVRVLIGRQSKRPLAFRIQFNPTFLVCKHLATQINRFTAERKLN